jgi:starch synthase
MRSIRALAVASEIYPIIKTGGLADVVGALPVALNAEGIEVRTIVPGFPDDADIGLGAVPSFVPDVVSGSVRPASHAHAQGLAR